MKSKERFLLEVILSRKAFKGANQKEEGRGDQNQEAVKENVKEHQIEEEILKEAGQDWETKAAIIMNIWGSGRIVDQRQRNLNIKHKSI